MDDNTEIGHYTRIVNVLVTEVFTEQYEQDWDRTLGLEGNHRYKN